MSHDLRDDFSLFWLHVDAKFQIKIKTNLNASPFVVCSQAHAHTTAHASLESKRRSKLK